MSVGNLKTQGQKGTNWTWQYRMLLGLDKIAASVATNGLEYEAELVSITCTGPTPPAGTVIRLEVRVWDATTGGFDNIKYYRPGETSPDPADYTGCTKAYLQSGDATEATLELCRQLLATIDTDTGNIATSTAGIESNTDPIGVTPALLRPTTSGTVTAGARSVSIANVGAESGTVLGIELAAGETVTFDAGSLNNTLSAVTYDPTTGGTTATTFLIATLT